MQGLPERSTVSCNMEEAGITTVAERLGLSPATAHLAVQLAERAGGPEGDVPGFNSPAQVSTSAGCEITRRPQQGSHRALRAGPIFVPHVACFPGIHRAQRKLCQCPGRRRGNTQTRACGHHR